MRVAKGGTSIYCPSCEEVTVCAAKNPSAVGKGAGQRMYFHAHQDIQFFRRVRVCQECGHRFLTAEVGEKFLDELVELRVRLREIKGHAEAYMKESGEAADALAKLTESLKVLRALNIYRKA